MIVGKALAAVGFMTVMVVGQVSGEVKTWRIGIGGEGWEGKTERASGIDFTATPGSVQPREARANENLALRFKWNDGQPADFTLEGTPRIWDNAALEASDLVLVDGDPSTSTENRFKVSGGNQIGRSFFLDLGEPFPLNRIVFYPRQTGFDVDEKGNKHFYKDDFLKGYELFISDGRSFSSVGQPVYTLLKADRRNRLSRVDVQFSPQSIRFIRLRSTAALSFEVAEIEFYGFGFSTQVEYQSQLIDLGENVNFGELVWDLSKWKRDGENLIPAPETSVSISVETRSGVDDTPDRYFAKTDTGEVEVPKSKYDQLSPDKRLVKLDGDNWSLWSVPLTRSGERITSPGPRRYFQFRITLSGTVMEMARLSSLLFRYSTPPFARRILAEIALLSDPRPLGRIAIVPAGKRETFIYDVRAEAIQIGFDALRIAVPSQSTFRSLEMGDPLTPVTPDSVDLSDPRYLTIYFPSNGLTPAQNRPLRVTFETAVLIYGTAFTGEVFDKDSPDVPQPVEAGDANKDVGTDNLQVIFLEASTGEVLTAFAISPSVITPNGDGVNEEAVISYTISQLIAEVAVEIRIYNLSGALIRAFPSERKKGGIYDRGAVWNGLDDARRPVPPGIYTCQITIHTDSDVVRRMRTIQVVY